LPQKKAFTPFHGPEHPNFTFQERRLLNTILSKFENKQAVTSLHASSLKVLQTKSMLEILASAAVANVVDPVDEEAYQDGSTSSP
jgi:hypothetical protein